MLVAEGKSLGVKVEEEHGPCHEHLRRKGVLTEPNHTISQEIKEKLIEYKAQEREAKGKTYGPKQTSAQVEDVLFL